MIQLAKKARNIVTRLGKKAVSINIGKLGKKVNLRK